MNKTYHWVNTGTYNNDCPNVALLACYYTRKDGRKIKGMILSDSEDIEHSMSDFESKDKKGVPGRAWYPSGSLEEINKGCREDIHRIMFSPF